MTVIAGPVTVTTSATLLSPATTSDDAATGFGMWIRNTTATTVFLGPSNVTTATGNPLNSGEQVSFDCGRTDAVYGITASGSAAVNVFATGA